METRIQDKLTDFRKVSKNGNTLRKNQFLNNLSSFDQKVSYFTENLKTKIMKEKKNNPLFHYPD